MTRHVLASVVAALLVSGAVLVLAPPSGWSTPGVPESASHASYAPRSLGETDADDQTASSAGQLSPEVGGPKQLWDCKFTRTGCGNWKEILLTKYDHVGEATCIYNCALFGEKCFYTNYQPTACEGSQQVAAGTCYLFGAGCIQAENACWDLYAIQPDPACDGDSLHAEGSGALAALSALAVTGPDSQLTAEDASRVLNEKSLRAP